MAHRGKINDVALRVLLRMRVFYAFFHSLKVMKTNTLSSFNTSTRKFYDNLHIRILVIFQTEVRIWELRVRLFGVRS